MISQSSKNASQQSIDFLDLPIPSIPSSYRRQKNATSTETLALKDTFSKKKQCLDADCNSCPQHSMSEANILRKEYISMLESNNDNEEAKIELENIESSNSRSMKTNRDLLQSVTVNSKMERKFEFQQMLDVAQELAKTCLRNQPCVPADWEDAKKISTLVIGNINCQLYVVPLKIAFGVAQIVNALKAKKKQFIRGIVSFINIYYPSIKYQSWKSFVELLRA